MGHRTMRIGLVNLGFFALPSTTPNINVVPHFGLFFGLRQWPLGLGVGPQWRNYFFLGTLERKEKKRKETKFCQKLLFAYPSVSRRGMSSSRG